MGSKSKGKTYGTGMLKGCLREERSSYTPQDPPTVRDPAATEENLWGEWRNRGSTASTFPAHLGTGELVGILGLILCPQSLHPAPQSPSPIPRPTPSALLLHAALGDPL